MLRKIQSIHTAPETMMGPIKIRQAFPLRGIEQVSPFILLHHFDFTYLPHENNFNVPPHPHRGFSPVTFYLKVLLSMKILLAINMSFIITKCNG